MATPTKDEIERARSLVFSKNGPDRMVEEIAQALADTRERETERCAVKAWSIGMDEHNKRGGVPADCREVGSACAAAIRNGA